MFFLMMTDHSSPPSALPPDHLQGQKKKEKTENHRRYLCHSYI